jgi:hypothetical protein
VVHARRRQHQSKIDASATCHTGGARRDAVVTCNPIRPAVLQGNPAKGLAAFGFDPNVPLVLVGLERGKYARGAVRSMAIVSASCRREVP